MATRPPPPDGQRRAEVEGVRQASERRWRTLVQNVSDCVTVVDGEGFILSTVGELRTLLGYPGDSWVGRRIDEVVHPEDMASVAPDIERLLAAPGAEVTTEVRVRHHDGSWAQLWVKAVNLLADPEVGGVVLTTRNVTAERQTEQLVSSQARILELIARGAPLDDVLDEVAAMIEDHDEGGRALVVLADGPHLVPRCRRGRGPGAAVQAAVAGVEVTPRVREILSSPHGEPVTMPVAPTRPGNGAGGPDAAPAPGDCSSHGSGDALDRLRAALAEEGVASAWVAPVHSRERPRPLAAVASFHGEHHEPGARTRRAAEVACALVAIALERHTTLSELSHRSLHDELTGLPNRTLLLDRLATGIERARRSGRELAVLYIDLDRFKVVNDSLGHLAGDVVLAATADHLRAVTRPGDTIARVGADEFVVVPEQPGGLSTVLPVAGRLTEALRRPFSVDGGEVFLTASLGVALAGDGVDGPLLLRNADAAMYRAKQRGRNRLEVYDAEMQAAAHDRLALGADLRRALAREEMRLVYQPVVDLASEQVVGAEALLRWDHPTRGEVPPSVFVPVAEESGVIAELGAWVVASAVGEVARTRGHLPGPFTLWVNLSARQLDDPALVDRVADVLAAHDWPAGQLCLELTETALSQDVDIALGTLVRLRELGARVAVDDFGTGYSSLAHLQRLPIDAIKIDRSFVQGLAEPGEGRSAIATAVVGAARALGLEAVAEGVEEPAQLDALRRLGCPLGQGYLFSPPVPIEDLLAVGRR